MNESNDSFVEIMYQLAKKGHIIQYKAEMQAKKHLKVELVLKLNELSEEIAASQILTKHIFEGLSKIEPTCKNIMVTLTFKH